MAKKTRKNKIKSSKPADRVRQLTGLGDKETIKPLRIVIDMQGAQTGSRFRGIGRYTMDLTRALVRNRGDHEILLVLNGMLYESIESIRYAFSDLLPRSHIRVWSALSPVFTDDEENTARRHIAEAIREDFIRGLKPDLLIITSFFEGFGDNAVHSIKKREKKLDPLVAVIFYDVIPLIQKEIYLEPNPHFMGPYYNKIEQLKNADLLLSISESSRSEAIQYLGFSAKKVVSISAAVDGAFHPRQYTDEETGEFKKRLGIRDHFIMYSGATDDRKNHLGLISAYAMLPKEMRATYQLVIVGGMPFSHQKKFIQHIRRYNLDGGDVVITGRVSDDDLVHAYCVCDLYVFPSWHEGFGLPALEAMSCGAPVIGANTTSVPEVIGCPSALFDPHSPQDIANKIQEVLTQPKFLAELKAHALVQSKSFSWDESARWAIEALESLAFSVISVKCDLHELESKGIKNILVDQITPIIEASKGLDLLCLAQAMARNIRGDKPQLLVDVSELVQRDSRSGIQRVVRSILQEWLSHPPKQFELRLVYASHDRLGYRYADRFTQLLNGQTSGLNSPLGWGEDLLIDFGDGDVFVALDMQHEIQIFQAPFYQRMRAHGVDVRFVVYDLLPVVLPQYFPLDASSNHASWLEVVADVDGVVCISRAVAKDFKSWLQQKTIGSPQPRPKIDWFHLGADIESSKPTCGLPENAEVVLAGLRAGPTFLMVGTVEPRKGHEQVIQAFENLWKNGTHANLLIVGNQGWKVEHLAERLRSHQELGKRLLWLEGISDEYLKKIYAASTCLIAASYGEGFGLPLIEAAQHKLPIIARDIAIFREVAGEFAYYFDGQESAALTQNLDAWLRLYGVNRHPTADEMPWLTWKESARGLLKCLLPPPP